MREGIQSQGISASHFIALVLLPFSLPGRACDLFCLSFCRVCPPNQQLITSGLPERMQQTGQKELFRLHGQTLPFQGPVSLYGTCTASYLYSVCHASSQNRHAGK